MKGSVLITGASGFIGSFLVEEALGQGLDVYAGIRKNSSRRYLNDSRIHLLELDLSSQHDLESHLGGLSSRMGGLDYVIHNAGITYAPSKKDFARVNHDYTKNLVEALQATAQPGKKFVLMSSLAAFGPGNPQTFEPIRSADRKNPISAYGKSKLLAEEIVRAAKFPWLIINPTAVYGPRDKDFLQFVKLVNHGLEAYIGRGRQMLSLVYVKDLARVAVLAMMKEVMNRDYIISDGHGYEKEQLGEVIRENVGRKTFRIRVPMVLLQTALFAVEPIYSFFGRQPFLNREKVMEIASANWLCDGTEIWNNLRVSPQFSLEKGIRETIDWYRDHKMLN